VALSCVVASSLAAQSPPATSSIADDPDVQGAQRLFSAWLEGQIAYRGLPGIVVGVVADQQLVWATGFGLADIAAKRPMTPATKFRMASHSKLFTATAIMQLREQGKLRLDDPVSKYLPWFQVKPAGDDDGPITIEQLLGHASGLPREAGTALDDARVSDGRRGEKAHHRAPGRVPGAGSMEVFEPRVHDRRHGRGAGERHDVGGLPPAQHFRPVRHDVVECGQERGGARGRVHASHA
jgi:CubicO group peptidase (beta-lactamase class C family)